MPELEACLLFVGLTSAFGGVSLIISSWIGEHEKALKLAVSCACGSALVSGLYAFTITTSAL